MALIDPDALQRLEELLALCRDKDSQLTRMQTAIETLTRMVELGKSKPVEEEIVLEHDVHGVDLSPEWEAMVGSLRGELQRAYTVISALEEENPGATPAVFQSLLRSHAFCLFCGAPTEKIDKLEGGLRKRPDRSAGWHTDDEAVRVHEGGGDFVKFWYGSGYAGHGGRSGSQIGPNALGNDDSRSFGSLGIGAADEQLPPPADGGRSGDGGGDGSRPPSRSSSPGRGPAGWGGGGVLAEHQQIVAGNQATGGSGGFAAGSTMQPAPLSSSGNGNGSRSGSPPAQLPRGRGGSGGGSRPASSGAAVSGVRTQPSGVGRTRRPHTSEGIRSPSRSAGELSTGNGGGDGGRGSGGGAVGGLQGGQQRQRPHTSTGNRGDIVQSSSVGGGGGERRPASAMTLGGGLGNGYTPNQAMAMLARSGHPSAQAMSRRLRNSSWSAGPGIGPSFRSGSGLAQPNQAAFAANTAAAKATSPGGRTQTGNAPRVSSRGGAGQPSRHSKRGDAVRRSGSSGAHRHQQAVAASQQQNAAHQSRLDALIAAGEEEKEAHLQRFLEGLAKGGSGQLPSHPHGPPLDTLD